MSYAVCVTFKLHNESKDDFIRLVKDNAKSSLELEEGCKQFDVLISPSDPCKVFLYEIYNEESDFQAHVKTPHFLSFDAATKEMIDEKAVDIYELEV